MDLIDKNHQIKMSFDHSISSNNSFKSHLNAKSFAQINLGQNRKTDEEYEEGFQLTMVQFDRDGEGDMEALGIGYCRINI